MFRVSWVALAMNGGGGGFPHSLGNGGRDRVRLARSSLTTLFCQHQWVELVTRHVSARAGNPQFGFNMMVPDSSLAPALEDSLVPRRYLFLYVATGAFGFTRQACVWQLHAGRKRVAPWPVGVMPAITIRNAVALYGGVTRKVGHSVVILFILGYFWRGDRYLCALIAGPAADSDS